VKVELAALSDEHFAIPAGFSEAQPAREPVLKLADGIGLVEGLPGDSQPLFVELADQVIVIEAPNGPGTSEAAIAKIAAATHGKPIRAIAFTHPHNDHAAGLRPYVARGITILTPPVWKPYVDALAAAPHTFAPDRLAGAPRAPIVETWTGEKVITDGKRTIRLVAMGPSPHCEETVIVWIPDAGVLYQGDNLILPRTARTVPPGAALTRALADLIRTKKWDVKVIAGTHGRPGTMADLAAAVAGMR
jgi:glyoxylase-like metal-dependent hydrolase (beta-lactamase superfamily II)